MTSSKALSFSVSVSDQDSTEVVSDHQSEGTRSELDDTDLVSDIESIEVGSESDVSTLLTTRGDEGADGPTLNLIQFLDSLLDLALVGLQVAHENLLEFFFWRMSELEFFLERVFSWPYSWRDLARTLEMRFF